MKITLANSLISPQFGPLELVYLNFTQKSIKPLIDRKTIVTNRYQNYHQNIGGGKKISKLCGLQSLKWLAGILAEAKSSQQAIHMY